MGAAGLVSRPQCDLEDESGHCEPDHDRRQHERLGQRIGVGVDTLAEDGLHPDRQASHDEDEEIDRIAEQREPDDHGKRPAAENEKYPAADHDRERRGDQGFHRHVAYLARPTGAAGGIGGESSPDWETRPSVSTVNSVPPTTTM